MQNIAIIGGSGFLGQNLIKNLNNWNVTNIDKKSLKKDFRNKSYKELIGDANDKKLLTTIKIRTFYEILNKNIKNKKKFLKSSEFPIPKNTTICNSKLKKIFKTLLTPSKKTISKILKRNEV